MVEASATAFPGRGRVRVLCFFAAFVFLQQFGYGGVILLFLERESGADVGGSHLRLPKSQGKTNGFRAQLSDSSVLTLHHEHPRNH